MAILSVSVPEELKQRMSFMDEVNWSAVAREAFEEKIREFLLLKKITAKSKLTEKDALEKLDAGADLIQIFTGFIYEGPSLIKRINKALLK